MPVSKRLPLFIVEARWRPFSDRPHPGEVFVGRTNEEVWDRLFVALDGTGGIDVAYYGDPSTKLSSPWAWFTHWMPVGEVKDART